jgi:ABC-type antimicrobial peptide transport system permease subunit
MASSVGASSAGNWFDVIGVVANFTTNPNPQAAQPIFYRPIDFRHINENPAGFAIRVRDKTPAEMTERIRSVALSVDPMLRFGELMPMDDWLDGQAKDQRLLLLVMIALCASAVLLAAAGISALMSFTVSQRRREIGVRLALGAARGQVLLTVLSRTLKQLGYGIAAGVAFVALLVDADQPTVDRMALVLGVGLAMTVVGVIAAFGPTREGLRIDPTEALKGE